MKAYLFLLVVCSLLLSGCNELSSNEDGQGEEQDLGTDSIDSTTISISEIKNHPNRYLNTEVDISGYYFQITNMQDTLTYSLFYITDNPDYYLYGRNAIDAILYKDNVDESILIYGGEYYWTGIIEQIGSGIRLNVTYIKPV